MMFIDFNEFCTNTHDVVRQVVEFVGADPALLKFKTLPPGMQVGGRWGSRGVGWGGEGGGGGGVRLWEGSLLSVQPLFKGCVLFSSPFLQGERRGRRMHPSCKRKLMQHFAEPNLRLYALLGRDFKWADPEGGRAWQASNKSSYMSGGGIADIGGEDVGKAGGSIKAGGWDGKAEGSSGPAGSVSISIAAISAAGQV